MSNLVAVTEATGTAVIRALDSQRKVADLVSVGQVYSSNDPDCAAIVASMQGVQYVAEDMQVQWISPNEKVSMESLRRTSASLRNIFLDPLLQQL